MSDILTVVVTVAVLVMCDHVSSSSIGVVGAMILRDGEQNIAADASARIRLRPLCARLDPLITGRFLAARLTVVDVPDRQGLPSRELPDVWSLRRVN